MTERLPRRTGRIAADPNPITVRGHTVVGTTTIRWDSTGTEVVEVRVGAPDGPLFAERHPGRRPDRRVGA